MADKFELVIIGGGPAGYEAALDAVNKGIKTALVESRELGGTCLNRGCIPTKTLLHSAELFAEMKKSAELGIFAQEITCDMEKIQNRKNEVLTQLRGGIEMLMKKNKIAVYYGKGTILNPHEILVKGEEETTLEAENILVATGSVPSVPPIPGADLHDVHTSDTLLDCAKLYPRLTIIGGGVIGMEFASVYSALGVQVTVVEFLDRILANMDKEISQNLKMIMKKRGVDIHASAKVEAIKEAEDGSLVCCYSEKEKPQEVGSDAILIATGRRANTEGLFAQDMEVEMERGRILVNELGQTSISNIYAAGDVTPAIQLAHAATANARNIVAYLAHQKSDKKDEAFVKPYRADQIPGCVYTNPEIGSIGLTQDEAKAAGIPVIVKKYPMSANGKTVLSGVDRGFIKVLARESDHCIIGAQMMCARATDMIGELETAIVNHLTLEQLASVVHPHPTFCEAIGEAVR